MANEQVTDQHNSDSAGAGDDSGKAKKLAGKFDNQEALEKGYKEAERKLHEANERYARLEDRMNRYEVERSDEGYGRGNAYVEPAVERQQVQQQADGSQFLTRFYSNPEGTLAEVEERAAQRAEARIAKRQQQQSDYSSRVARWTAENQDVAPYGDLLTHYVGQTDARLAPETRLDKAAEAVRKRVLELKGKTTKQNDDPEQFVDGATSNHEGGGGNAAPATKPLAAESQLKTYVTGRNATARKPLQHGGPRK